MKHNDDFLNFMLYYAIIKKTFYESRIENVRTIP